MVEVERTEDLALIKSILCHPDIYPLISDDTCPPADEFEPPLDGIEYIAGIVRGEPIGLMVYLG